MKAKLFTPIKVGNKILKNRIAMAPLTRSRSSLSGVHGELNAEYYRQRAGAGLIVSEATPIAPIGIGYPYTPGIWNDEQVEGWKVVTDSVHKAGGVIYCQLWHVGRVSHSKYHNGDLPVSASDVKADGYQRHYDGKFERENPRPLTLDEIEWTTEQYAKAAENAIKAGFDGVEIHGANGYLIHQFLCDGTNKRKDKYGGSIENRSRFGLEVVDAVCNAVGSEKTAIRLSPSGTMNDIYDSNPVEVFDFFINELNKFDLSYLHVMEPLVPLDELPENYLKEVAKHYRNIYKGVLMTNGGFDRDKAINYVENDYADMIAFGKLFISNPDLAQRLEKDLPLAEWDTKTFYLGGEKGYTDYPTYGEEFNV